MDVPKGSGKTAAAAFTPDLVTQAREHVVDEDSTARLVVAILRGGERDGAGHDACGTEAGIDLLQAHEAGEKDAGAGDEQEGHGHLAGDENGAQALLAGTARAGANGIGEPQRLALAQHAPHRRHAGADCGDKSDGRGCEDETEVGMDGEAGGEVVRNGAQDEAAEQGTGEDPEHGGETGEQQNFRDEERCDVRAGCAERDAQRELTGAGRCAGEEEAGDIETGDEQHAGNHCKEGEERLAQIACGVVGPGLGEHAPSGALAEAAGAFAANLLQVLLVDGRIELRDGDAGTKADDTRIELVIALIGGVSIGRESERHPYVAAARPVEVAAHDADHAIGLAVENEGLADGVVLSAEETLPCAVAEHDDAGWRPSDRLPAGRCGRGWVARQRCGTRAR